MILFFGDPHTRFSHVLDAVMQHRPAAIVLLGDIQARRPLDVELASILDLTEVWFIHGNHDTDTDLYYDNLFGSQLADRNLHGRVVEIAGVRVAGLGGVFRGGRVGVGSVWRRRRGRSVCVQDVPGCEAGQGTGPWGEKTRWGAPPPAGGTGSRGSAPQGPPPPAHGRPAGGPPGPRLRGLGQHRFLA